MYLGHDGSIEVWFWSSVVAGNLKSWRPGKSEVGGSEVNPSTTEGAADVTDAQKEAGEDCSIHGECTVKGCDETLCPL